MIPPTISSLFRRGERGHGLLEEARDATNHFSGSFQVREMPGSMHQHFPRLANAARKCICVGGWDHAIGVAPDQQRGGCDAIQTPLQIAVWNRPVKMAAR